MGKVHQHLQMLTCSVHKKKEKITKLYVKFVDFLLGDEIYPVTSLRPNQITYFWSREDDKISVKF